MSVVIGLLVLVWALLSSMPALNHAGISVDSPWRAIPVVVFMVYLLVGAGGIVWLMRHPLLRCPECKQSLAEGMAPPIAIVTGRCSKCAARLFEDDAALVPVESAKGTGVKLLSRAELLAAERDAQRSARPRTIKWILCGGFLLALGGVSGAWLKSVLASRLGELWTPFVLPVLVAPGIAVGCWAIVVWDRVSSVARLCPHCSAEITPQGFAAVTGNCSRCGGQAVSDPFPGMLPRSRRRERRSGRSSSTAIWRSAVMTVSGSGVCWEGH